MQQQKVGPANQENTAKQRKDSDDWPSGGCDDQDDVRVAKGEQFTDQTSHSRAIARGLIARRGC